MIRAINQFRRNKSHIEEYGNLFTMIQTHMPTLLNQGEDILRAEIVMIVSAMDTYYHDIVRTGLLQIYQGQRTNSNNGASYSGFSLLDLTLIKNASTEQDKLIHIDNTIRRINSKDSYQSPQSIEYAMNLVGVNGIWSKISPLIGLTPSDTKTELSTIIRRRNQIAHESDINPATMTQFSISKSDADHVVSFISQFVEASHTLL